MNAIDLLKDITPIHAAFLFLGQNLAVFAAAVALGRIIQDYSGQQIIAKPGKLTLLEISLTISTILLNSLVTLAGWWLWKNGFIKIRFGLSAWDLVDFFVLFFVMDFSMYVLHRLAHYKPIYPYLHAIHHKTINVRPITLFVLHPVENSGFGLLWLLLLIIYPSGIYAIVAYLIVNVIYGVLGHTGAEPIPVKLRGKIIFRIVTSSYFHAWHHAQLNTNFGFYTTIPDLIFKSLGKNYFSDFVRGKFLT